MKPKANRNKSYRHNNDGVFIQRGEREKKVGWKQKKGAIWAESCVKLDMKAGY